MSRRLRIGLAAMNVSDLDMSGGVGAYAYQLARALADYGPQHDYLIYLYEGSLPAWQRYGWPANVTLVGLKTAAPRSTRSQRLLRKLGLKSKAPAYNFESDIARQIDETGADLVHFPNTTIYPLAIQTRCVLTFFDLQHEYYPELFSTEEVQRRSVAYRASVAKAVKLITPSAYTRQSLIEKYQVPPEKMMFVPAGFDEKQKIVSPSEIERVRAKYNLPAHYVFYPANPWPHKNHARLIAALRLYKERFGELPALVLSGRLRTEVRDVMQLAIAAGVEDRVLDLGYVPTTDLPALYACATLLVFPSLFEGFGIPLVEAMALGCPITAANATAIPDCVGEAALLFDPFDSNVMAEAIHTLWHDEKLRADLIAKGLRRAPQYYWQAIVPRILDVYQAAVG